MPCAMLERHTSRRGAPAEQAKDAEARERAHPAAFQPAPFLHGVANGARDEASGFPMIVMSAASLADLSAGAARRLAEPAHFPG